VFLNNNLSEFQYKVICRFLRKVNSKILSVKNKIMVMKIKISATYEGKCDLCKEEKIVFTAGDEDTKKVVTICEDCAKEIGDVSTSDVIEKHGKVDEDEFEPGGIEIKGLDKIQEDLKHKIEEKEDEN